MTIDMEIRSGHAETTSTLPGVPAYLLAGLRRFNVAHILAPTLEALTEYGVQSHETNDSDSSVGYSIVPKGLGSSRNVSNRFNKFNHRIVPVSSGFWGVQECIG